MEGREQRAMDYCDSGGQAHGQGHTDLQHRQVCPPQEYPQGYPDTISKESSSIYEKIYPMRLPMMAIGGIVFLVGLGMFIGGFAGLVADMDVKIRRTGSPNIGYMLMLIVSIVVMVGGGVAIFCGCGAIRYNKRMTDIREGRIGKHKTKKPSKNAPVAAKSTQVLTNGHSRTSKPNGNVTYTVTYQYRGPPPAEINGIPAYPAPPHDISPTLKIDSHSSQPPSSGQQKLKSKCVSVPPKQAQQSCVERERGLALENVPRKLVLIKRV